ncbi:MAG TPA: hypothetical protein VJB90_02015 [Candidatus Nanoarchaeia archaeon]|nr:hypothetical protein [Candidatus Nanoarchaeia archaeon]
MGDEETRGLMKGLIHWITRKPSAGDDVVARMRTEEGEAVGQGLLENATTSQYLGSMTLPEIPHDPLPEDYDERLGFFRRIAHMQRAVSIDDYVANCAPKVFVCNNKADINRATEQLRRYLDHAIKSGFVLRDQQLIQLTHLGIQYYLFHERVRYQQQT